MTLALILICLVALAAVCGLAAVAVHSRLAPGPSLATRTIELHTRRPDDQSLRGVLIAQHADRVTLREVVYLHQSGDRGVAGVVHIPVGNIAWMREIEPVPAEPAA